MFDATRQYELTIRPLGRNTADEYYHNGSIWIEGREGNNYTIDLTNRSHQRALFILSVDGLDVLEGKPAGLNSQGYIIPAGQTISVPGWKVNDQQAAEFYFSRSRESYVNSIGGTTTNTGVIGVMIFSEYKQYYEVYDMSTPGTRGISTNQIPTSNIQNIGDLNVSESSVDNSWIANGISKNQTLNAAIVQAAAANIPMNSASAEVNTSGSIISQNYLSQEVGTGFGKATDWQTVSTQFRRNNPTQPDTIMAIYYNTARNLEKMGIRLRRKRDVQYKADPFPAYSSTTTVGCPTPYNWKP